MKKVSFYILNPKLNMWRGIHGDVVIGLVFFNATLPSEIYRHHLEGVLLAYFDDLPLDRICRFSFQ